MKNILYVLILSLFSSNVCSQLSPPEISFEGINYNWQYISKDTNFIKNPLGLGASPYSNRFFRDFMINEENLYLLELVSSQNPYTGLEGTLLHKLNLNSGELKWINHNNYFSGNEYRESYAKFGLYFRPDGNLNLYLLRDRNKINLTFPTFGFYGDPVKKIINDTDGHTIAENITVDTFQQLFNSTFDCFIIENSRSELINVSRGLKEKASKLYINMDFMGLDGNSMSFDTPFVFSYSYNSEVMNTSQLMLNSYYRLTRDTILSVFFKTDTTISSSSPREVLLVWFNVSDLNNIKVEKELEIREVVYFPQTDFNGEMQLECVDENIFIYQTVYENAVAQNSKRMIWLAWYDKLGNFKGRIDKLIKPGNNTLNYLNFGIVGVRDNSLYLIGKVNELTYDVLRFDPNQNSLIFLYELKILDGQDLHSTYLDGVGFLPGDNVLINIWVQIRDEEGHLTSFRFFNSFKNESLGLPVNTQHILPINDLLIYPNPVRQILSIQSTALSGKILITDMLGRKQEVKAIQSDDTQQIDVSGLIPGCYQLSVVNEQGYLTGTARFIKVE